MTAVSMLVVEDNPQDWILFGCLVEEVQQLTGLRIVCEWARTGMQALDRMRNQRYDTVLMDQQMPEMSGSEVMAAISAIFLARTDRPRILAYSNCDLPEFGRKCLAEGADAFLPKYMTPEDLARFFDEFGLRRRSREGLV